MNLDGVPSYTLMPFQLGRFQDNEYLIVNESGEYHFMQREDLESLIDYSLPISSDNYDELRSKQFLVTGDVAGAIDMIATRYRTRKRFISDFTALHMMVLTLRCNQDCEYCQVSSVSDDAFEFDMSPEVAERSVEFAFRSPCPAIKIEFQGGEPTLNWTALTSAVLKAEALSRTQGKRVDFVVCTNLRSISQKSECRR